MRAVQAERLGAKALNKGSGAGAEAREGRGQVKRDPHKVRELDPTQEPWGASDMADAGKGRWVWSLGRRPVV